MSKRMFPCMPALTSSSLLEVTSKSASSMNFGLLSCYTQTEIATTLVKARFTSETLTAVLPVQGEKTTGKMHQNF